MVVTYRPELRVQVSPKKVHRGQMIAVMAFLFDHVTREPATFKKIYMQIIDEKGIEVWPMSTMAENTDRIEKLISTAQLKSGMYQLRVSPSKKLTPMGYTFFEIEKPILGLELVPLIPLALLGLIPRRKKTEEPNIISTEGKPMLKGPDVSGPNAPKPEKITSDFIGPKEREVTIRYLIYTTEKDARVCPICKPHEGKVFAPKSDDIITIGPEELGGQTHWGCRCHYDMETQFTYIEQLNAQFAKVYQIYQVANVAKEAFNLINEAKVT